MCIRDSITTARPGLPPPRQGKVGGTSMLVESLQLRRRRSAGCATMADSPCGHRPAPSTEAH
eukprot:4244604-Alexandrium_andersonii.AAC.1